MKLVVITGSPHKHGTSAMLADQFIRGATESGHTVYRFDAAFKDVHPCIACEKCHNTDTGCVFKDSIEELNPELLSSDGIIFISPIYYYMLSAQIKTVIDRFYANGDKLHDNKKTALILTFADDSIESADGPVLSFKNMAKYLEWEIVGTITAKECATVDDLIKTNYPKEAYTLGENFQ